MSKSFSSLLLSSITCMCVSTLTSATELNWHFLRGGSNVDVSSLSQNHTYIPGRYLVDVELNGQRLGKKVLTVTERDSEQLCLEKIWLDESGITINPEFYTAQFDEARQCYVLDSEEASAVNFDLSVQVLTFQLPQKALRKVPEEMPDWDYGIPALRMNYNANMNVNEVETSLYGYVGLLGNIGNWRASTSVSVTDNGTEVPMLTASRALKDWKADLTLGKTFTSNSLIGGAPLIGVGFVSNSSMSPNDVGYSPTFSGIASSDARVTLTQNGNVVYSEMVPPGPFEITNVNLLSSGDVIMRITESDGTETEQLFPLTIVPNMLTPGDIEYSVHSGLRDGGEEDLDGLFVAASSGYGFEYSTLRGSALVHAKYAGAGVELVTGLSYWGTLGLETAYSFAKYDHGNSLTGAKLAITYAKTFTNKTDLSLIGAKYISRNYTEFASFYPSEEERQNTNSNKTRYEFNLNHQFTNGIRGSISGWQQRYWDNAQASTGVSTNISLSFDYFNVSMGAFYSDTSDRENYGGSLSVSVPFSVFDTRISSYGTMNVSQGGEQSYTAGVSQALSDKLDYSASASWNNSFDDETYSLRSTYRGERALLSSQISQRGDNVTGAASISGSAIVLPTESDFILTRDMSETVIIANVSDTEGVQFTSSPYPSNARGNAVVPASAYRLNNITLSGDTLPLNTELFETSKKVVPSGGAVVYLPFEAVTVKRYLLQVRDKQGVFVPTGTWAESDLGVPLGFISQSGILFVNSIDSLGDIHLGECIVKGDVIKETLELQEVTCE